jgi:hypothetical protein
MLQRTEYLGEVILMFEEMMGELIRFFLTFGLMVGLFLLVGVFMKETFGESNGTDQLTILLDLFNAFNGQPNFKKFSVPFG